MITLTAKLYKDTEWATDRADMIVSPAHAAQMLAGWARMYSRPEPVGTGVGVDFWFRDRDGYNLLVKVTGATVEDLRAAYREGRA